MQCQENTPAIVSMVDGQAVTTTTAIAAGCKVEHASVIKLVRGYQGDLEEFGLLDFKSESTGGRPTELALLNEQQATLVMTYMRNTAIVRAFKKRLVREFWRMAREQRRAPEIASKVTAELAIMECYTRLLKPAPSSQNMMLARIASNNGLDSSFLPAYAVDAAANSTDGSSMPTKALTALLREHGVGLSAAIFNERLASAGYLKQLTRTNSKGETVSFWSVTTLGLNYGKNLTSPRSPRETQPHWYIDRFAGLVDLIVDTRAA